MREKIIPKLLLLLKPFWKKFGVVLILILISKSLELLLPYLLAKMIDAPDFYTAVYFVGISFILWIILRSVLSYIRARYEILNIGWDMNIFLHNISVSKLLGLSIGQHKHENSGVKHHLVSQGQNSIEQIISETIFTVLPMLVQIVVTIILITVISPTIGLFILSIVAIYLILTIWRNLQYRERIMNQLDLEKESSKITSEVYRNMPFIILEAQEEKAKEYVRDFKTKSANESKSIWVSYYFESSILKILIGVAQFGSLALVLYWIFQGEFSKGMFIAFFSWVQQSVGNIEVLSNYQRRFMQNFSKVRKYFELMEKESDIKEPQKPIKHEKLSGEIEFKDVTYSYSEREDDTKKRRKKSLDKVSFVINSGEKVGIVGESGAGKSTLINLLRRASDPTKGSILVDGINLRDIDTNWYRSNIGNVEQDIAILDVSLRDNILFGMNGKAKDVSYADLEKACKMASIYDFIEDQEKGFDTMIGERGIKLSGGERQRVAIARALIKNPKILIFDEATSALDAHNEGIIHESIKKAAIGRTTIIIAHRLSTVLDADKIIVMDKGRIVGIGKHAELQETCPEYQKLIKNQVVAI